MFEDLDFELMLYKMGVKPFLNDKDLTCFHCGLLHCDYYTQGKVCPVRKHKFKNKYRKFHNYVYENLKRYGNTIVSEEINNAVSRAELIDDLKRNGFENIHISNDLILTADYNERNDLYKEGCFKNRK